LAFLLAAMPVAVTLIYVATRAGLPLRDAELSAMDAALGFHWMRFARWVYSHHRLAWVMAMAYSALVPQSLVVVAALARWRPTDLTRYLRAYLFAFTVTALTWAVFPALGAAPNGPSATTTTALRLGTLTSINILALVGIVSMPSFHAAAAVLMAVACWPIPWLRWPTLLLDAGMLVATVPMGAHYLVDVIAGVILAGYAAWVMGLPTIRRTLPTRRDRWTSTEASFTSPSASASSTGAH
jgi:membrane-associated phospholipid phosphatase